MRQELNDRHAVASILRPFEICTYPAAWIPAGRGMRWPWERAAGRVRVQVGTWVPAAPGMMEPNPGSLLVLISTVTSSQGLGFFYL